MTLKSILILIILIIFTNCGFKAIDQNYFKGFDIVPRIEGDERIAYLLSNNLKKNSVGNTKRILIDAQVKKNKNIKEKNIKNEITKYEINILISVTYRILDENKTGSFKIEKKSFFDVNDKHSITLNNEKKLVKNLVQQISKQILNDLQLKINDL